MKCEMFQWPIALVQSKYTKKKKRELGKIQ